MSNKQFRDVGPVIRFLREKMLGRKIENPLRFEPKYAARTQPDPVLPDGPSHKLYGNYYYLRDARRKIQTPLGIAGPEELKKLASPDTPESKSSSLVAAHGGVKPGPTYDPPHTEKDVVFRPKSK